MTRSDPGAGTFLLNNNAFISATCLQTGATLITNNHHFDTIRDQGIIEVWSTAEAIRRLL